MKGDVTDKLIWRVLAETQFTLFCLPIKKANIRSCCFCFCCAAKLWAVIHMEKRWLCLRVGCWGGYVDVADWAWGKLNFWKCAFFVVVFFLARSQNCEKRLLASSCLFSCPSVRLSAWYNSPPTGRVFMHFDIWVFFRKVVEKIQVSLKSDSNNGWFTWRLLYIFYHISLSSS